MTTAGMIFCLKILSTLRLNKYLLLLLISKKRKILLKISYNSKSGGFHPPPVNLFFCVNLKQTEFHKFTKLLSELGGSSLSKFEVTILYLSKKKSQLPIFGIFYPDYNPHLFYYLFWSSGNIYLF